MQIAVRMTTRSLELTPSSSPSYCNLPALISPKITQDPGVLMSPKITQDQGVLISPKITQDPGFLISPKITQDRSVLISPVSLTPIPAPVQAQLEHLHLPLRYV